MSSYKRCLRDRLKQCHGGSPSCSEALSGTSSCSRLPLTGVGTFRNGPAFPLTDGWDSPGDRQDMTASRSDGDGPCLAHQLRTQLQCLPVSLGVRLSKPIASYRPCLIEDAGSKSLLLLRVSWDPIFERTRVARLRLGVQIASVEYQRFLLCLEKVFVALVRMSGARYFGGLNNVQVRAPTNSRITWSCSNRHVAVDRHAA